MSLRYDLDEQFLDAVLNCLDLLLQLGSFMNGDRSCNDGTRNITGTTQR